MRKALFYIIIGIAISIGAFFAIKWEIQRYKLLNQSYLLALRAVDMLQVEFPDQASDYIAKLQASQAVK